jgi:hypothetical protein
MATLIDKLRRLFSSRQEAGSATAVPPTTTLNDATITELMRQIEATQEGQYTCEETSALLDEYVELAVSEQDAANLMPLVEAHLQSCPECHIRYDILVTILETEEV